MNIKPIFCNLPNAPIDEVVWYTKTIYFTISKGGGLDVYQGGGRAALRRPRKRPRRFAGTNIGE
jgi:hypothetical protein